MTEILFPEGTISGATPATDTRDEPARVQFDEQPRRGCRMVITPALPRLLFVPSGKSTLERAMKTALQIVAFLLLTSTVFGQAKQFDVVVYGGTAGGVMTAVAAAREGLTVAVLEPGKHLGGMVTGGLSRTDFGKKEVIGGIALEFYQRAGKKYGREIEWMPEPHVAEAILNEMIQEAKTITVFLNHRLKEKSGVRKQGTRLMEITMENGARVSRRDLRGRQLRRRFAGTSKG